MLSLIAGSDTKKSRDELTKKIDSLQSKGYDYLPIDAEEISEVELMQLISSPSLFNDKRVVCISHLIQVGISETLLDFFKASEKTQEIVFWERSTLPTRAPEGIKNLISLVKKKGEVSLFEVKKEISGNRNDLFQFADSWARGDGFGSLRDYARFRKQGIAAEELFWTLHWQVRAMLLIDAGAKEGKSEADIASSTRLHPFVIKKNRSLILKTPRPLLEHALKELTEIDRKTKTSPVILEDAFYQFLLN